MVGISRVAETRLRFPRCDSKIKLEKNTGIWDTHPDLEMRCGVSVQVASLADDGEY